MHNKSMKKVVRKQKAKKQSIKSMYFDYASATPIDAGVFSIIEKTMKTDYANPSALHSLGVKAHSKLNELRSKVAAVLSVVPKEVVFTSGATEANVLMIQGVVGAYYRATKTIPHIIVSAIEHASILETCAALERDQCAEISHLPVTTDGIVDTSILRDLLKPNTVLVSVHYVNNEIGTIQPLREIAKIIRHYRKTVTHNSYPYIHTDASQAPLYLPLNIPTLGVDAMTLSSGKIYGPKGVGALYVRRGIHCDPLLTGGGQEFGLRSGTENIPLIAGFTYALEKAQALSIKENARLKSLQQWFFNELEKQFKNIRINGSKTERTPNNINISIEGVESEELVVRLDARGIFVSAKSACDSDNEEESHVIRAMYKTNNASQMGSLRISFGRETTRNQLNELLKTLHEVVHIAKEMK